MMGKKRFSLFVFGLLMLGEPCFAQSSAYQDSLARWRQTYKAAFTTEERSPLTAADTGYLRFYPIREKFRVVARVTQTMDSPAFNLPTHSGFTKRYRQWGIAHFSIGRKRLSLRIYQSPDLMKRPGLEDHLAIFFNDRTNYEETYAGGRYIDVKTGEIAEDGTVVIDFNKAYNPYCAYASGYNCPVPPRENRLPLRIAAGEKLYAGMHKE